MGRGKAWRLTLDTLCQEFLDALVSPSAEDIVNMKKGQSRVGVDVRCTKCGKVFNKELYHIINAEGSLNNERSLYCPKCSKGAAQVAPLAKVVKESVVKEPKVNEPRVLKRPRWVITKDMMPHEFLDALVSPTPEEIEASKQQSGIKLQLKCIGCGEVFEKPLYYTLNKDGNLSTVKKTSPLMCSYCNKSEASKAKWQDPEVKQKHKRYWSITRDMLPNEFLDALVAPSIDVIESSNRQANTDVTIKCIDCGKPFITWLNKVITRNGELLSNRYSLRCPSCSYSLRNKVCNKSETHSTTMEYKWQDQEYRDKQTSVHKKEWQDPEYRLKQAASRESYANDHLKTEGTEAEIREFVNSLDLETKVDRTSLQGQEIDIMIPSKSIGIEVNGLYWHASDYQYIPRGHLSRYRSHTYHQEKFLQAKEAGIHLIQITDYDWFINKDKIKAYLHDLLSQDKKVYYARKLQLHPVNSKVAKEFYKEYHLQGCNISFKYNLGLFDGEGMISCMSFGPSRIKGLTNPEGYFELHRYCIKKDCTVLGGAEKLFKHFVKEYNATEIKSFSDNDYFSGGIYERLGFENVGLSRVYCWYKGFEVREREKCQLKVLKPLFPETHAEAVQLKADKEIGNVEVYIMEKEGYSMYNTAGRTRWLWKSNKEE